MSVISESERERLAAIFREADSDLKYGDQWHHLNADYHILQVSQRIRRVVAFYTFAQDNDLAQDKVRSDLINIISDARLAVDMFDHERDGDRLKKS